MLASVFGCRSVRGLTGNLSDLTVASSLCVIRLCSETGLRFASCVRVASSRIRSPCLAVPGQDASGPRDSCIRTRWLRSISPTQIWVWLLQMLVLKVCGVRQYLYVFNLYCNPEIDDPIFVCLFTKWLTCRLKMSVPRSCLWEIWMAIIRSGSVLPPLVMQSKKTRFFKIKNAFFF